jgi:hypothetical protein
MINFVQVIFHTRQIRIIDVVEHGLDHMNEGKLGHDGDMPAGAGQRESRRSLRRLMVI